MNMKHITKRTKLCWNEVLNSILPFIYIRKYIKCYDALLFENRNLLHNELITYFKLNLDKIQISRSAGRDKDIGGSQQAANFLKIEIIVFCFFHKNMKDQKIKK